MRQIEAENDKLKNILPKNFARQELDKRRLGEVVDLFTNVQMAEKGEYARHPWPHLRVLSGKVCRGRRQKRRRILYASLYRKDTGRNHRTLPRTSVRPLLR